MGNVQACSAFLGQSDGFLCALQAGFAVSNEAVKLDGNVVAIFLAHVSAFAFYNSLRFAVGYNGYLGFVKHLLQCLLVVEHHAAR